MMMPRRRLRRVLQDGARGALPGVCGSIAVRLILRAGFAAVCMTGARTRRPSVRGR